MGQSVSILVLACMLVMSTLQMPLTKTWVALKVDESVPHTISSLLCGVRM